eukprot:7285673-Pyramimonas_sp.AAC.1
MIRALRIATECEQARKWWARSRAVAAAATTRLRSLRAKVFLTPSSTNSAWPEPPPGALLEVPAGGREEIGSGRRRVRLRAWRCGSPPCVSRRRW